MFRRFRVILAVVSLSLFAVPAAAATIVIDTFEDGTTRNWRVNLVGMGSSLFDPVNVPTGGPAGAGDNFLRAAAIGGGGAGSRLAIANDAQWAGNYLGLDAIEMDVINLGGSDLFLRLVFEDPLFGPPTNIAFSDNPILVPANSGWMHISFPIHPAALQAGLGSVLAALANTTVLRIYHSAADNFPNPLFPITPVVAALGIDNIALVPEPGLLALMGIGGAWAASRRRKVE